MQTTEADAESGRVKPTKATPLLSPADIRADLARLRLPLYQLAARVEVHPARLSPMLYERAPLPARIAARIADVLADVRARAHENGVR